MPLVGGTREPHHAHGRAEHDAGDGVTGNEMNTKIAAARTK